MRIRIVLSLLTALVAGILLTSCDAPASTSDSPLPDSPVSTAAPEPTVEPLVFPTSQPGLGTVTGMILDASTGESIENELYLGDIIETTDPEQIIVGLDQTTAPKALLDVTTGAFAFYDVPPGRYALEIWRPLLTPVLVPEQGTNITLLITVEPDQIINLGTLLVPIP